MSACYTKKSLLVKRMETAARRSNLPPGWGSKKGTPFITYIRSDGMFITAEQEVPGEPANWVLCEDEGQGVTTQLLTHPLGDRYTPPRALMVEANKRWPVP